MGSQIHSYISQWNWPSLSWLIKQLLFMGVKNYGNKFGNLNFSYINFSFSYCYYHQHALIYDSIEFYSWKCCGSGVKESSNINTRTVIINWWLSSLINLVLNVLIIWERNMIVKRTTTVDSYEIYYLSFSSTSENL